MRARPEQPPQHRQPTRIAVDIGNSALKLQQPDEPVLRIAHSQPQADTADRFDDLLADWLPASACQWWIASVQQATLRQLLNWLERVRPDDAIVPISHNDLPLRVAVADPAAVGIDRLLAAVAVNLRREPERPAIIVEAGSAVTVDGLSPDGEFLGGAILPGIPLSAAALSLYADQLPLLELRPDPAQAALGTSTEHAIHSGLQWGLLGAVRELAQRIASELPGSRPQLFISGGDQGFLQALVSADTQMVSHLVLEGIWAVAGQGRS